MPPRVFPTLVILSFLILDSAVSEGALYQRALTITRPVGAPASSNVQVPVVLTPDNFDYNHVDPSGAWIRFTDSDQLTALTCFVESWNLGGTSIFWIKVPSIPAVSKTVYLFYSTSAGELTPTVSDFAATFPNRYVLSAGSAVLTGNLSYDWFQIDASASVIMTAGSPLTVTARRAAIHGTIQARGKGYSPSFGTFTSGLGPAAGQASFNASAGGGGHGGAGGAGYFNPVSSLPPYGSSTGDDVSMGSSGANGGNLQQPGGAGGGAVTITAARLDMTGTVNARGDDAPTDFASFGSGGGSGGGVLLRAYDLRVTGTIMVDGGDAGSGGGGGGGGGGRIKLLSEHSSVGTPTLLATGGDGDAYFPAGSGAAGTIHTGSGLELDEMVASVGSEIAVAAVESGALDGVRLSLPIPNPSRGRVAFRIDLPRPMSLSAEILDVQGRRVKSLAGEVALPAGGHDLVWDHLDGAGRAVATGVYLAHFTIDGQSWTRRIAVPR